MGWVFRGVLPRFMKEHLWICLAFLDLLSFHYSNLPVRRMLTVRGMFFFFLPQQIKILESLTRICHFKFPSVGHNETCKI